MTEDTKAAILEFLRSFVDDPVWLEGDRLFTSGVVDSLLAIELVTFVETRFHITIEDTDLEIENFDSVDAICGLISRSRAAHGI